MPMTLAELITKAELCGRRFSTAYIPLKFDGQDVEISLEPIHSYPDGWIINLKIEKK